VVAASVEAELHGTTWWNFHREAGMLGAGRRGTPDLATAGKTDECRAGIRGEDRDADLAAGPSELSPRVEVADDLSGRGPLATHPEGTVLRHSHPVAEALALGDEYRYRRSSALDRQRQRREQRQRGKPGWEMSPPHPTMVPKRWSEPPNFTRPATVGDMPRGRTSKVIIREREGDEIHRRPDELIVEEPLEIRLDGNLVTTTMRTPGNDFELAAGFCFTEGLLGGAPVKRVRYCGTGSAVETEFNVVTVETGGEAPAPAPRLTLTTSSCGLCGSASIDDLRTRLAPLRGVKPFDLDVLAAVPMRMREEQALFERTGAVHAAGAFDEHGDAVVVREDVGRHNAVDKVVGRLLLDGHLPARELGLYVSGRASFEIVQKAWAAGFSCVVAVSAPSSLAVETAEAAGLALIGFVRGDRLNLYTQENDVSGGRE